MTVYRVRPLPRGILRGRYRISPNLINDTQQALRGFFEAGRYDGGHALSANITETPATFEIFVGRWR